MTEYIATITSSEGPVYTELVTATDSNEAMVRVILRQTKPIAAISIKTVK